MSHQGRLGPLHAMDPEDPVIRLLGLQAQVIELQAQVIELSAENQRLREQSNPEAHAFEDGYKRCGHCKRWLREGAFSTDHSRRDGLRSWCRFCDQGKRESA